jgi:hypothetical protein
MNASWPERGAGPAPSFQIDGSEHRWSEGRAPACVLLVFNERAGCPLFCSVQSLTCQKFFRLSASASVWTVVEWNPASLAVAIELHTRSALFSDNSHALPGTGRLKVRSRSTSNVPSMRPGSIPTSSRVQPRKRQSSCGRSSRMIASLKSDVAGSRQCCCAKARDRKWRRARPGQEPSLAGLNSAPDTGRSTPYEQAVHGRATRGRIATSAASHRRKAASGLLPSPPGRHTSQ